MKNILNEIKQFLYELFFLSQFGAALIRLIFPIFLAYIFCYLVFGIPLYEAHFGFKILLGLICFLFVLPVFVRIKSEE